MCPNLLEMNNKNTNEKQDNRANLVNKQSKPTDVSPDRLTITTASSSNLLSTIIEHIQTEITAEANELNKNSLEKFITPTKTSEENSASPALQMDIQRSPSNRYI